jgi:TP901 family phage tail tape measure protein
MDTMTKLGILLIANDQMSKVVGAALGNATKGFGLLTSKADEFRRKLEQTGTVMNFIGHQILEKAAGPIQAFSDINEASNKLRVAMMNNKGEVSSYFGEIDQVARKMGTELAYNVGQIYDASTALIENGMAIENVAKGTEAASKLAQVLNQTPAYAAEMVAKFREAFNLSENEFVKMADMVQKAKFAYGLDASEIKYAAAYYGPMLDMIGQKGAASAKIIFALQGAARQIGIDGSQFGTGLRQILGRMSVIAPRLGRHSKIMQLVNEDLKKHGIALDFFTSEGKFAGWSNFFTQMHKLDVLSHEDKGAVFKYLFGDESEGIANLMAKLGPEGVQKWIDKMNHQASLSQRINQNMTSLEKTWAAFTGTMKNFWAAVAAPAMEALLPMINALNTFLGDTLQPWIEENKTLFKWIGFITLATGGLLVAVGSLCIGLAMFSKIVGFGWSGLVLFGKRISRAVSLLALLARGLAMAVVRLVYFGVAAGVYAVKGLIALARGLATATLAAARFAIALLANPITWIVLGIIALCAAVYLIYKYWGPLSEWLKNLWDKIVAGFSGLWESFKNAGAKIIGSLWEGIKSKVSWLIENVKGVAAKVMNLWPQSPAKDGPLRNLSRVNIIGELAKTINAAPLVKAMSGAAAAGMLALSPMAQPAMAMPPLAPRIASSSVSASGSGITVHYAPQITISGHAGPGVRDDIMAALRAHKTELVAMIEEAQRRRARRVY